MKNYLSVFLFALFIISPSSWAKKVEVSKLNFFEKLFSPKSSNPDLDILQMIWSQNLDPSYNSGNLPVALQSPLLYENHLYVGFPDKGMAAYEVDKGRMVWFQKSTGTYHGKPVPFKDYIIYGSTEGRIYSRHYLTGELKYEVDLGDSIESEGVVAKGRVLFQLRNHQIFCLDAETGKILWGHKRSVPYLTTLQKASAPLVVGSRVILGHADGNVVAYSLEDGSMLWEQKLSNASKFMDVDMRPLLFAKKILVGPQGGNVYLIDPGTGSILGQYDTQMSRIFTLKSADFPSEIVVANIFGDLIWLDNSLKAIKTQRIADDAITDLVYWAPKRGASKSEHYWLVGSISKKLLIKDHNLVDVKKFEFGHEFSSLLSPLQTDGENLVVLTSRNRLYVFK